MEIQPTLDYLIENAIQLSPTEFKLGHLEIEVLITGIGILHTTFTLTDYLSDHRPDFWIQSGIGGAFDPTLEIGNVYVIKSEMLVGIGAEEKDGTLHSPFDLNWLDKNAFPYSDETLVCPEMPVKLDLPEATGMTTLHSHGNVNTIETLRRNTHGQIENMEGAAFFYVSLMKKIPFASIRSISNLVEERNKEKWDFQKSIHTLNKEIIKMIHSL